MANVTVEYKGEMLFEGRAGNHTIRIDVPPTLRGKDRGMTPTELCAVSLTSCIGVMVAAYCENMKIDTTGLTVGLSYEKLDEPSRLGNFKATIRLPKGGWEERKEAILRVAKRCPVHETMSQHPGLDVSLES